MALVHEPPTTAAPATLPAPHLTPYAARSLAALVSLLVGVAMTLAGGWSAPAAAATSTQIQQNLAGTGYYSGPIDGSIGPVSIASIKAFQADRCTARDGNYGPTTDSLMVSVVKQIQAKVGTTQDGWFGPGTKSKVQAWQSANGLTADGVVGPVTMSKMGIKRKLSCVGTLTFDKNPSASNNSRLIFTIKREGATVVSYSWRAGSGKGPSDPQGTNACVRDHGWLPNGAYDVNLYTDYNGNEIDEWALKLSRNGSVYVPCSSAAGAVTRFDLFVHQDYSGGNYTTSGCIAITRTNVKLLHDQIRNYFGTSGAGGRTPFQLNVIS